MSNFLKEIVKIKKAQIEKAAMPSLDLKSMFKSRRVLIIAEIKLATPTVKELGSKKDVLIKAKEYEEAKVDMISVVTEENFFNGDINFIKLIKENGIKLPVLHKDFIINPLQIYQSKFIGAEAILLIAKIVNEKTLKELVDLANNQGIEPIVEINDIEDLKKTLKTKTTFIAVNARDLSTFKINIEKACELLKKVPKKYIKLAFSGVTSKEEVKKYKEAGARGVLMGTSLMKQKDVSEFLKELQI